MIRRIWPCIRAGLLRPSRQPLERAADAHAPPVIGEAGHRTTKGRDTTGSACNLLSHSTDGGMCQGRLDSSLLDATVCLSRYSHRRGAALQFPTGDLSMSGRTRNKRGTFMSALELGFARLLDFSGSLTSYAYDHRPDQHDAAAIASDWQNVGGDIRIACRKVDKLIASSSSNSGR